MKRIRICLGNGDPYHEYGHITGAELLITRADGLQTKIKNLMLDVSHINFDEETEEYEIGMFKKPGSLEKLAKPENKQDQEEFYQAGYPTND